MVLVINAASAKARKIQPTDQRQSSIADLNACTVAAIIPAAAGVGMPTKYFDPPGAIPCTLKRARRHAQHTTNARQNHQPNCAICWAPGAVSRFGRCRTPHEYASKAGAIPKLTTSASESN